MNRIFTLAARWTLLYLIATSPLAANDELFFPLSPKIENTYRTLPDSSIPPDDILLAETLEKEFLIDSLKALDRRFPGGEFRRALARVGEEDLPEGQRERELAIQKLREGAIVIDPDQGEWIPSSALEAGDYW